MFNLSLTEETRTIIITESGKKKNPEKLKRVFLGGTCNESTWRDDLIKMLDTKKVEYFNPVVPDWTDEAAENELKERATCDIVLYVLTPKMTGVYSVAEVVDDSNKRPKKTVFCPLSADGKKEFDKGQWKSILAVCKMVEENGGKVIYNNLNNVAEYLNNL